MFICNRNFNDGTGPYLKGDIYQGTGELLEKCIRRGWIDEVKKPEAPKMEEKSEILEEKPKKKRKKKKGD